MNARALRRTWNIVGRIGGHQDLVNHVDEAVAGGDIGRRDGGAVHHDRASNRERERMTVHSRGGHAIRNVRRRNFTVEHVVEKDVRKGRLSFGSVQRSKVNTGVGKGLVRWRKHRERTIALQGFQEFSLDNTGDQ